jgi:hypothetical protein
MRQRDAGFVQHLTQWHQHRLEVRSPTVCIRLRQGRQQTIVPQFRSRQGRASLGIAVHCVREEG